uniref:Aspartate-semialdehyde dehydrogenase n=1 Tax=Clastoptera arizonana TaxID=38151 RepID=A0A1B6ED82_9HEMI
MLLFFLLEQKFPKKWGMKFTRKGTLLIDNSSAWRMNKYKKLIVPEINGKFLSKRDKLIANPNCSTIQLVMVLYPLHLKYRIKNITISTYQSVTGSGKKGLDQLRNEEDRKKKKKIYSFKIHRNVIPHCDKFDDYGSSKEELKLINETKKIFSNKRIGITSTSIRVPIVGGHSESINLTFKNDFDINELRQILSNTSGLILMDNIKKNIYPMPILCEENNNVFVGRIRRDFSKKKSLNMWIVSDNLRKGSATNAVQILEYLISNKLI